MKKTILLLAFAALLAGCDKDSTGTTSTGTSANENHPTATSTNLPSTNAPAVP